MNKALFERLVTTPGVSGREERIRELVMKEMEPLVDEAKVDRLGNIIGTRRGDRPRVMVSAHMDSIGFLVKHIDDEGFLRISPVGAFDARTLIAQRVLVSGKRDYIGLMTVAEKPVHLLSEEERKKPPQVENVVVDLMSPADEIKESVAVGDPVTLFRDPIVTDHAVTAPYLDDRLGVYVLLEALRASSTRAEVYGVISVQEEVGLRGAQTSAYDVDPDVGIALDITLATDLPGIGRDQRITCAGDGVAIGVMDGASISDPRLVREFRSIAERTGITHQMEILPRGGTDAGAIQMARSGVPVITISTPVRYVHTANEMAFVFDLDATVDLVARYLEGAHEVSLDW